MLESRWVKAGHGRESGCAAWVVWEWYGLKVSPKVICWSSISLSVTGFGAGAFGR